MMLLFFLLTAVAATEPLPDLYLDNSSTIHPAPFYPDDDTRIRWSQCAEYGKSLCFQSSDCTDSNFIADSWTEFNKGKLQEDKGKKTCNSGQMIRPISDSHWLVYFQFAAPGLDPKAGIKLYIENSDHDFSYVLGKCAYNEDTQTVDFVASADKIGFSETANEKTTKAGQPAAVINLKSELLHGFVDEFEMSCVFSIEAMPEDDGTTKKTTTIDAQLKKVFEATLPKDPNKLDSNNDPTFRKNEFKKSRLITEITRYTPVEPNPNPSNYDNGVLQRLNSPKTIEDTLKDLKDRHEKGLKKVAFIKVNETKDVEFLRNFTLNKVNKDFNSIGCSDKAARLIVHQNGGLREVTKEFLESETVYTTVCSGCDKSKGDVWKPNTDADIVAGCVKRFCLECDPLPPLLIGCDGCKPPLVKLPTNRRDCPVLQCDSDMWLFNEKALGVISRRDKNGIECRKGNDSQPGWFRSNGHEVTEAACAPTRNCTIFSPLNATTCSGVNSTNDCVIVSDGQAFCPPNSNLLYRFGNDKFELMSSSLECDPFMGTWYYGGDAHSEFNTSIQLKCEERRDEEFYEWDPVVVASLICVWVGISLLTPILIAIAHCWKKSRESHYKYRKRPINPYKRAVTQWPPAFADLTEVTDIMATPKADFYGIIQEWSMYSVVERVKFVTNLLDELGLTVKIDHYLSLFGHCVQMESDYRVWRKLVLGYKTILIGFNAVNRSRVGMKFQGDLLLCMNRLLNRIGYDHVDGADESLNFVRDMIWNTFLVCNDRIGIANLYEEGGVRFQCEDIRKRRQIFACRARLDGLTQNAKDALCDAIDHRDKTCVKTVYGPPMPDDEDFVEARREMRRRQGILVEETQPEKYWKIVAERAAKKKYEELVDVYGSYREHFVYAMCTGTDADIVEYTIGEVSQGDFLPRELVNCFRAATEDCFDMRYAAREAFIKNHKHVREKCPIGSVEYMEIFEMFMRFAHLEYNETDETWLMKHVANPGYFDQGDKEFLPITRLSEQAEYGRKFMAMLQQYKIKHVLRRNEFQKDDETPRARSPVRPMSFHPDAKPDSALRSDELEPYQSSGPGSSDHGHGFGSTTKSNQRSDTKSKAASGSASRSKQGTASNSSAPKPDTASNSKQEPGPGSKPGPAK